MAKRDESDEVERLYGLPLDEFVAERDAAAKRMRSAGDREGAARVKALRKPTVPAGAINRAVRADPEAAEALQAAGERLEAAQAEAVSRGDAAALREASSEHADAIERLMTAVQRELGRTGGAAAVDRARETLRAAAGDEELGAELAAGAVVRDREGVGFGLADLAVTPKRPSKPRGGAKAKGAKAKAPAKETPARKGAAKGPSAADRKRAEQAVRRAERTLDGAAKRLKDSERRLERARRALADAEEEVADAQHEHDEREAALAEARDAVPD
jgi:hypothetical protein